MDGRLFGSPSLFVVSFRYKNHNTKTKNPIANEEFSINTLIPPQMADRAGAFIGSDAMPGKLAYATGVLDTLTCLAVE